MLLVHQALLHWASKEHGRSDHRVFSFLDDEGNVSNGSASSFSFSELEYTTRCLAKRMLLPQDQGGFGMSKGCTCLLVYPPSLDFIIAFIAALRAQIVAVPVYPPRPGMNKDLKMFLAVQESSKAKFALTSTYYDWAKRIASIKESFNIFNLRRSKETQFTWPELSWFTSDETNKNSSFESAKVNIDLAEPSDLAFLQYTSGSTSLPKGVMLSQENLAHNLTCIIRALQAGTDTVVVSWLPIYHDMGLIGSLLGTLYCGGTGYYMSPISFIKNPPIWLIAASRYHATHLQAPNFAYKLTSRKFVSLKQVPEEFNLSSIRHIFNAAEPVDGNAIDQFLETFTPYGLKPSAMVPGYGLAEHTVYVCDGGKQRLRVNRVILETENRVEEISKDSPESSKSAMELVGCGNPHRFPESGISLIIVDYKTSFKLEENVVGEIWISSKSKSVGYFGLEEKTKSELFAKLMMKPVTAALDSEASNASEQDLVGDESLFTKDWLRTGDLGFLHNGELFICGRIKDLIIIRGRNHYPQDIEHSMENCSTFIRPGCTAAFTINHPKSGEEVLTVVAEVRTKSGDPENTSVIQSIRQSITQEHGVRPYAVVLVLEKSIPKTTSGKISRYRCRSAYLGNELSLVHSWTDSNQESIADDQELSNPTTDQLGSSSAGIGIGSSDAMKPAATPSLPLMEMLCDEAAQLLEASPEDIRVNAPLSELGFDSMRLTQFKGMIKNTFHVDIPEEILFEEKTTMTTLKNLIEHPETIPSSMPGANPGRNMATGTGHASNTVGGNGKGGGGGGSGAGNSTTNNNKKSSAPTPGCCHNCRCF